MAWLLLCQAVDPATGEMPLMKMKIDGREVEAVSREPILKSIRALGIKVPTLCHMDGLEPYGVCRMCVVEVKRGKRTRLVTSCNYPAQEGLEVFTNTERVRQHRRVMAELLLARCPDVPRVQKLAASVGVKETRFKSAEKSDCVLCGLCVRVCDEIVDASALSFIDRGNQRTVGTPWYVDPDACIACGACTYVCPTGAMQMEAQTKKRWQKELGEGERLCRYARMGLISHKVCPKDFDCARCEVDQRLFDEFGTHPMLVLAPGLRRRPRQVGHFAVVEDRSYFQGHTWVKLLRERARVGLDDFAQRVIGDITAMEFRSRPGDVVRRGDPALNVASNGHRATLLFPVSGRILQTNPVLDGDPSLLNEDCYQRGWLYVMKPGNQYEEARKLVRPEEASQWLQADSDRLLGLLTRSQGAALSDGGELLRNFSRNLREDSWNRLAQTFFSGSGH
jgi:bidirectional [NiFe] hydrogenase diaphorase subunit